jgi:hypothetical protein
MLSHKWTSKGIIFQALTLMDIPVQYENDSKSLKIQVKVIEWDIIC